MTGINYEELATVLLRRAQAGGSEEKASVGEPVGAVERAPRRVVRGRVGESGVADAVRTEVGTVRGRGSSGDQVAVDSEIGRLPESEVDSEVDGVVVSDSGSMSGGEPGVVGSGVRRTVVFGDLASAYPPVSVETPRSGGFFSTIVKGARTVDLRSKIQVHSGFKLPKSAGTKLAVCTFSAGTMPEEIIDGRKKLTTLSGIGDAALTLHLAMAAERAGRVVDSAQAVRAAMSSDAHLCRVMVQTDLVGCVMYASGVDKATAKTTVIAFLAILGVLVQFAPNDAIAKFLSSCGIIAA